MHIYATVLLCGVVTSEGSDQERLSFIIYAELNLLADVLKHLRQGQVYELQPYREKYLMQVFKLQAYIEKRNSCAHLQMFCCVVPSEGNKCYGRSVLAGA